VIDHSGVQKYLKPYIDAYINRQTSIAISADHIFLWQPLHSRSVSAYTTVPAELSGYSAFTTPGFWGGTPYANIPSWVASGYHPNFDRIRVAVHLTAPAQIRINGTLSSTTYPAGVAFFDIPLATGTTTVAIVRGGVDVLTGTASKAITTNAWPGGWNYLIEQIAVSKKNINRTIAMVSKYKYHQAA